MIATDLRLRVESLVWISQRLLRGRKATLKFELDRHLTARHQGATYRTRLAGARAEKHAGWLVSRQPSVLDRFAGLLAHGWLVGHDSGPRMALPITLVRAAVHREFDGRRSTSRKASQSCECCATRCSRVVAVMSARATAVGSACPLFPSGVDEGLVLRRTSDGARRPALNSRSRNTRDGIEVTTMRTTQWLGQPAHWLAAPGRTHRTGARHRCLPRRPWRGRSAIDAAQFDIGLSDESSNYPSPIFSSLSKTRGYLANRRIPE